MGRAGRDRTSRTVYVPSGVSSFFEICDHNSDGSRITDALKVGARGGGFIIERGSKSKASAGNGVKRDSVVINGQSVPSAKTTLKVIRMMRKVFDFVPVEIIHSVEPPIGSGFGTSGAGAISTAIALSDLFDLNLTLSEATDFAHSAEIESVTGLGTVISLASGSGAVGIVTEPGAYSVGRVDTLLSNYDDFTLICACFGPIEKSSILQEETKRNKVNKYGRIALKAILEDPTPESLLGQSRMFAEKTGIASSKLLDLSDKAVKMGAVGATQNMIGNAIHCLVEKRKRAVFLESFQKLVPRETIFESNLTQSGPVIR